MSEIIIFYEGGSDKKFIEIFLSEHFKKKYDKISPFKTVGMKKEERKGIIRRANDRGIEYIYLTDLDESPCLVDKRSSVSKYIGRDNPEDKIVIVCNELESWLYAGLGKEGCMKLNLPLHEKTDSLSKEEIHGIGKKCGYNSWAILKNHMINEFKIKNAIRHNDSFEYFYRKYLS
ncbi:MAG: DUF4276 family protein [Candidatus Methanoplasma sp.]|jgi:hypothetical protein|nr:DUF4276 family protein [Candidatus Methanoplasma sp.]